MRRAGETIHKCFIADDVGFLVGFEDGTCVTFAVGTSVGVSETSSSLVRLGVEGAVDVGSFDVGFKVDGCLVVGFDVGWCVVGKDVWIAAVGVNDSVGFIVGFNEVGFDDEGFNDVGIMLGLLVVGDEGAASTE